MIVNVNNIPSQIWMFVNVGNEDQYLAPEIFGLDVSIDCFDPFLVESVGHESMLRDAIMNVGGAISIMLLQ